MPDPKDNQKQSGDTHPPEVEDDAGTQAGRPAAGGAQGNPPGRSLAREPAEEAKTGEGGPGQGKA